MTRHAFMYAFDSIEANPLDRAAECPARRRARSAGSDAFPFPGDVAGVAHTGCLPRVLCGQPRVVFDYVAAGM